MEVTAPGRPNRYKQLLLLFGLLTLALTLRCWGLTWGVPNAQSLYPYHPDEPVMLGAICRVSPLWGDVTPGFYNYGSFTINLTKLVYDVFSPSLGWRAVPQPQPLDHWVGDFAHLLLLGRWLTVLFGVGTVLLTFALGKRLYGERSGAWAGAFLAAAPAAVVFSHFLTVDVPATFFTTLALLAAATALHQVNSRTAIRWVMLGAVAAGVATGIKYNSFPAFFSLAVPLWSISRSGANGKRTAMLAAVGAIAVFAAAFVFATPGCLLEPERFRDNVLYELGRNREGQGLVFRDTPPAVLYHLGISLPIAMEWPLYVLALAGLIGSLRRRSAEDALLWLFLIPSFLLLAPAERKFVRYVTPLLPPMCLLAAAAFQRRTERRPWSASDPKGNVSPTAPQPTRVGAPAMLTVSEDGRDGVPTMGRHSSDRRLAWAVNGVALCAALASSIAHVGVLAAADSRDQTAAWVGANARQVDTVALASDSWNYTPPLAPSAGNVKSMLQFGVAPAWETATVGDSRPHLTDVGPYHVLAPRSSPPEEGALPVSRLKLFQPRYVVVSDFEWEDPERVRRAEPDFKSGLLTLLEAMKADGYVIVHDERPRPSLFGFTWWSHGTPPHDWRYFMPEVRVYERKASR